MTTAGETLVVRADAGPRIGTGHVMRCLALAQAWQDGGGRAVFITAGGPSPLESRLTGEGFPVEYLSAEPGSPADATRTAEVARREGAGWVVADGYHFRDAYERDLKAAGRRVLAVDDFGHADHAHADLVLNQNLTADEMLYTRRGAGTRLLLGTRFVLLRREFLRCPGRRGAVPDVARKVLVSLGGSDPDNATGQVLRTLAACNTALEVRVLVGAANPHKAALAAFAGTSDMRIRLEENLADVPGAMIWADFAVIACGTTTWEAAYLGLPCVTVVIAENQVSTARRLDELGIFPALGDPCRLPTGADPLTRLIRDPVARTESAIRARHLVDGAGAARVVRLLIEGRERGT